MAEGGRGGSKSHFFANLMVAEVFSHGKKALCCRETQSSIKESVKSLLSAKIKEMGLSDQFIETQMEIVCRVNAGRIAFTGLRQSGSGASAAENIKSYEGFDICWVEEAQTVSKFSLDILLPTIRKEDSEVWFSYNRKKEKEAVHSKFVESEHIPNGTCHIYVNYYDNPWFPQELRELMESDKANSIDDYNHIWLGLPQKRSKATIFTKWKVAECSPGPDDKIYFGLDFGFFPHPCAFLRSWVDFSLKRIYIDYCIFALRLDASDIADQLLPLIPHSDVNKIWADGARPEIISALKKGAGKDKKKYQVEAADKWAGSVDSGVDWLQKWEIWIHPRCKDQVLLGEISDDERELYEPRYNLVQEFQNYKKKTDKETGEVLPVIIDDYNHGIDSLRYSLWKLIKNVATLDYARVMSKNQALKKFEAQKELAEGQASALIPKTKKKKLIDDKGKVDNTMYVNARSLGIKIPGIN